MSISEQYRPAAHERLHNLLADYQHHHRGDFNIDPVAVYRRVYRSLGNSDTQIEGFVTDTTRQIDAALLDRVASSDIAIELVKCATQQEVTHLRSVVRTRQDSDTKSARLRAAIADIRPHVEPWIDLLETYSKTLPPDPQIPDGQSGECVRSYVEHELRAMRRDLGALLTIDEQPDDPLYHPMTTAPRMGDSDGELKHYVNLWPVDPTKEPLQDCHWDVAKQTWVRRTFGFTVDVGDDSFFRCWSKDDSLFRRWSKALRDGAADIA